MNYWRIENEQLPSKGLYYPSNFELYLRPMIVEDVKYLATFNQDNAHKLLNEIIKKCVKIKGMKFEDIIMGDREFIIFWIRSNTFATNSGYMIKINNCQICHEDYEHELKLANFNQKFIKSKVTKIWLPSTGIELPIYPPTIKSMYDSGYDQDNIEDIPEYATYINTDNTLKEKINFIENMPADDFAIFEDAINLCQCGMNKTILAECPTCHHLQKVHLILNDFKLFPKTKLRDILDNVTRIAKYTNVQITDLWSWIEVELELDIVNNMIKEENEQNQKEMAKAKAKAHIPSTPHIPRH